MKKVVKIIAGIGLLLVLLVGGAVFYFTRGLEEGREVTIEEVELAELEDGTYTGRYEFRRWTNEVEVEISDNEITNIMLIEGFDQEDLREEIYQRVIDQQSVTVDTVSGATTSSKSYLKAIENALADP
jgi:uncharacterized protein with FMN-binding domain